MMFVKAQKKLGALALLLALTLIVAACGGPAPASSGVGAESGVLPTPTGTTGPQAEADPEAGTPEAEADPEAGTPVAEADPEATPGSVDVTGGDLVLYTTRTESLIKPVIDAFNKSNPDIKVVLLTGNNAELSTKMLEERANPRADVFINTDVVSMVSLAGQGLFQPMTSSDVTSLPATYRADDNSWAALTLRPRVIMYNTNLVKQEELPDSVLDLTDSKWKGQIGSADSTNGSMQGQIVAMRKLLGEAKTEEFIKGLVANDTKFFGGHTDVRKAVGAGELKLGLVNHYYYHLSKKEGAPVGIIYPDQGPNDMGLVVNSTNAGIIKGARNAANAETFIDYLLTAEGQKVFADLNFEYPVVKGVPLAEGVDPLDQFKISNIDLKTLGAEIEPSRALMERAGLP